MGLPRQGQTRVRRSACKHDPHPAVDLQVQGRHQRRPEARPPRKRPQPPDAAADTTDTAALAGAPARCWRPFLLGVLLGVGQVEHLHRHAQRQRPPLTAHHHPSHRRSRLALAAMPIRARVQSFTQAFACHALARALTAAAHEAPGNVHSAGGRRRRPGRLSRSFASLREERAGGKAVGGAELAQPRAPGRLLARRRSSRASLWPREG